jgi:hypothetical protein
MCNASPAGSDCTITSPFRVPFFNPTRPNRFAIAQYWSWVHFSSGWLWQRQQLIEVPRNVTVVDSTRSLKSLWMTK